MLTAEKAELSSDGGVRSQCPGTGYLQFWRDSFFCFWAGLWNQFQALLGVLKGVLVVAPQERGE